MTLFRAWYSRTNLGQLAGAAEISMNSLNARVPIGGQFGDITYPVNSPLAITMFAPFAFVSKAWIPALSTFVAVLAVLLVWGWKSHCRDLRQARWEKAEREMGGY